MSEKRFELILIKYNDENDVDESWWAIKDNETDKTMQDVETVDLLNKFYGENEQLKLLLKDSEYQVEILKESNKKLMESLVQKESED